MERVFWPISEILSGGARGADMVGEAWARIHGYPVTRYVPAWDNQGKKAGFMRNAKMVEDADAIIALWNGISKGTMHTVALAQAKEIPGVAVCYDEGKPSSVRWWTP